MKANKVHLGGFDRSDSALNNNFAGEGLDGICSLLTFFLKVKSNSANVY